MLDFELPLVRGAVTVAQAIAEIIESNKSGLLYEVRPGELRLIHYYGMVQAASQQQGSIPLGSVVYESVIDSKTIPHTQLYSFVNDAGRRFGLKGMSGSGMAQVFSILESYGYPYSVGSPGRRCTRKNKPATTPPRDWYHYPPENINPNDPNNCRVCGDPLE